MNASLLVDLMLGQPNKRLEPTRRMIRGMKTFVTPPRGSGAAR
jgi:hypothetical protein